jgi:hypothetical protein
MVHDERNNDACGVARFNSRMVWCCALAHARVIDPVALHQGIVGHAQLCDHAAHIDFLWTYNTLVYK